VDVRSIILLKDKSVKYERKSSREKGDSLKIVTCGKAYKGKPFSDSKRIDSGIEQN